ncbi:hypothetical protein Taro_006097 [Colocasia esculenta]|uniref:Pentatricopeptide repeat-containing protein n=1 Tax=Colocasia esculenta TaxID=4460 RepID=A0A843TZQ7_COLES|nr:hypothetical protein [Colocasia esculenta]
MFLSKIGIATRTGAATLCSGPGVFIFSHSPRRRLQQITFFPSLHALLLFRLPGPPATARSAALLHASSVWGSEMSRSCCPSTAPALRPGCPSHLFLLKLVAAAPASPTSWSLVAAVHCHIFKSGFLDGVVVATALVGSLARCSDLDGALQVFDGMCERDVAAWNAMLSGISRNGNAQHALLLFRRMLLAAMPPNSVTLSIILQDWRC